MVLVCISFCKYFKNFAFFEFSSHTFLLNKKFRRIISNMKKAKEFGYEAMISETNFIMEKYSFVSVTGLCDSILGRTIPIISIGEGKTNVFYIGGEFASDSLTPFLLMKFVRDISSLYSERASVFGFPVEYILKNYKFTVLPMLNPDGREYCIYGVDNANPIKDRLIAMNNGESDFKSWRGNARGVLLSCNYGVEETEYELEQEVGSLCNYLKYGLTPDMIFVFSGSIEQKDQIYYADGEVENKSAIALSQMSSIKRSFRKTEKPELLLADWAIANLNCRAFSIELEILGRSGSISKNGLAEDLYFTKYAALRKLLFCSPLLSKIH